MREHRFVAWSLGGLAAAAARARPVGVRSRRPVLSIVVSTTRRRGRRATPVTACARSPQASTTARSGPRSTRPTRPTAGSTSPCQEQTFVLTVTGGSPAAVEPIRMSSTQPVGLHAGQRRHDRRRRGELGPGRGVGFVGNGRPLGHRRRLQRHPRGRRIARRLRCVLHREPERRYPGRRRRVGPPQLRPARRQRLERCRQQWLARSRSRVGQSEHHRGRGRRRPGDDQRQRHQRQHGRHGRRGDRRRGHLRHRATSRCSSAGR